MNLELLNIQSHYGRNLYKSNAEIGPGSPFKLSFNTQTLIASLSAQSDDASSYASYHSIARDKNYLEYFENLVRKLSPTGQIVEVGCNNGELLERFVKDDRKLVGIDPTLHGSHSQISYFKAYWNPDFIKQNKSILAPSAIIARHVLEHVPDYQKFLSCLAEVSNKDTVLYLEVPDFEINLMSADLSPIFCEHPHYFTLPGLQKILNQHGWFLDDYQRTSYWGGTLILILRRQGQIHDFKDLEATILAAADNFSSRLAEKNKRICTELQSRHSVLGKGIACLGIGNRALNVLASLPSEIPIDYYFDNDPAKDGLIIPYQKKSVQKFSASKLNEVHTLFITGFGYEKQILKQISTTPEASQNLEIILCDPYLRCLGIKDLQSTFD